MWCVLRICFCVKHKKIGGTWPFNPHWLISLGRAGAMKGRNVPKPMEKKNLENQFKSLQLRRDLEMERTVIESSSRAVVFRLRNKMTEGPSPVGSSEASTSGKSFAGRWKWPMLRCGLLHHCMWYHENILNVLSRQDVLIILRKEVRRFCSS